MRDHDAESESVLEESCQKIISSSGNVSNVSVLFPSPSRSGILARSIN